MILQNLHTHTVLGDGKHTAEEMVLGAIAAGCTSLGFSEHSPLPIDQDPDRWTMEPEDVPLYRQEVLRLREKYAGELEIFLGLEQDIDSAAPEGAWDYLIGSVHCVWTDGCRLSADDAAGVFAQAVERHFGGDYYAYAEAYYRRLAQVVEGTGCQIVGHFDLVTKFNEGGRLFDPTHPRYMAAAIEALEAILQHDVVFEINTGAMAKGYRAAPYPAGAILKEIRLRGGRVCISSDCHHRDYLLFAYDQAAELARSCGFQESWVLTGKGFVAQGL